MKVRLSKRKLEGLMVEDEEHRLVCETRIGRWFLLNDFGFSKSIIFVDVGRLVNLMLFTRFLMHVTMLD